MDSYNRGYGAGIGDGENVVDGVDADGLGEAGKQVGGATVIDVDLPDGAQAAGFYAVAYEITDGSAIEGLNTGDTVISYRGTDNFVILGHRAEDPYRFLSSPT